MGGENDDDDDGTWWCCPRVSAKPFRPAEAERGRLWGGEIKERVSIFGAGEAKPEREVKLAWGGWAGVGAPAKSGGRNGVGGHRGNGG